MPQRAARRARSRDVRDAFPVQPRLIGEQEQVDDDRGGVEAQRLLDGLVDQGAEELARQPRPVDVRDVDAHHERGLRLPGNGLEERRLTRRELHGIGTGGHHRVDGPSHVLDAAEKPRLVEHAVIDGDVEASAVGGQQATEAGEHQAA